MAAPALRCRRGWRAWALNRSESLPSSIGAGLSTWSRCRTPRYGTSRRRSWCGGPRACGLAPALLATGRALVPALRQDTRTTTGSSRLRSGLVSTEVGLTVMLLVGGTLLFRSFLALHSVDPGIAASHVLTFRVFIPAA